MPDQNSQLPSTNPLLNRFFLSPQDKVDKDKGKLIVKEFYRQQTVNDGLGFFKQRNARQIELLMWAKGSQSMKEFLDYFNVSDANKSYVNMDMTQQRIAAQFIGTLVESMAKTKVYPCVKAIDDGSIDEKNKRLLEALYRMKEVGTINDVQQQSGIQVEPDNVFVPDDELSAKVYFELEDRLPKEIRFEQMLSKLMKDIKYERVISRKGLFDMITLNFEATMIEKLAPLKYTVRKCVPTNCIYNFFMNDTGESEVTMFGEFYNLKVADFRQKFGESADNKGGLSEKEIFELAKLSTTKNNGKFSFVWDNTWSPYTPMFSLNTNRPYDDYSILVLDTRIKCGEDVYYVSKPDTFGREDIQLKKNVPYQQVKKDGTIVPQDKPDDVKIIKGNKNNWMRGVYAPYGDKMLYWGAPDLIITNYTDVANPLSDFTINIPNNDGEYVPSLFERIMEPLREYSLTKLKRKQLIAGLKKSGIRIDVESARNLDLGSGDSIAWEEVMRIYDQTGNELWSSKGVDPLQRESPPLSNTVRVDDINQIIGLTNILAGIVLEIRQLIGVPQYRDGSDVGDRTSGVLQQQQNESSYNVTDFISNGHNQLWEETFYKVCLLHWNDIVKIEPESKDDMLNTRFDLSLTMKATEYEKQLVEQDIQRYSQMPDAQNNPSLSPKDAMMLRNIDDYKLACWYLTKTFDENRKKAIEDSQALQQQNQALQQQSAAQAQQQAEALQQQKMADEKEMLDFKYTKEKELAFINVISAGIGKGTLDPKIIMGVIQQLMPNISIPLAIENDDFEKGMQAKQMEDQMEQQQQSQQGQQQQQGQPQQGQPSPQAQQAMQQQSQQQQQPQMQQ